MGFNIYEDGAWKDKTSSLKRYKDGAWTPLVSAKVYENGAWVEKLGIPPYGLYTYMDNGGYCARIEGSDLWFAIKYSNGNHWARVTVPLGVAHPTVEVDSYTIMGLPSGIQVSTLSVYALKRNVTGTMSTSDDYGSEKVFSTAVSEYGDGFSWTPDTNSEVPYIALQYWFNVTSYKSDYYGQVMRACVSGLRVNGRTVIGSMSVGDTSLL